jgi:hypothetical protein
MAFTITNKKIVQGTGAKIVSGTYTNTSSSTGGAISTGLAMTYGMFLQPKTTAVVTSFPVVNASFPVSGAITIVTTADEVGYFVAIGN